jgi:hypothetical protein
MMRGSVERLGSTPNQHIESALSYLKPAIGPHTVPRKRT